MDNTREMYNQIHLKSFKNFIQENIVDNIKNQDYIFLKEENLYPPLDVVEMVPGFEHSLHNPPIETPVVDEVASLQQQLKDARSEIAEKDKRLSDVASVEQIINQARTSTLEALDKAQIAEDEAGLQRRNAERAERRAKLAEEQLKTGELRMKNDLSMLVNERNRLAQENERLKKAGLSRPTGSSTDSKFSMLGLDPAAFSNLTRERGFRLVETMRRFKAQDEHPDHGGNSEGMKKINQAADALRDWCERNLR